jgi:hypothetical protein
VRHILSFALALMGCAAPVSDELTAPAAPFSDLPTDQAAPPPIPFFLQATPFVTEQTFTLTALGLPAGYRVNFAMSSAVTAPDYCPPAIAPSCIALALPITSLGFAIADSTGKATLTRTLPASLPPVVEFQAYRVTGPTVALSNPLRLTSYLAGGDEDGDGLTNGTEVGLRTDPFDPDTDNDLLDDGDEVAAGTDPLFLDTDGDELDDGEEVIYSGTDPLDPDSDDDGLDDGEELVFTYTNPLDPDSDDDGLTDGDEVDVYFTDPRDADTDGGSVSDGQEIIDGTDPLFRWDDVP